MKALLTALAELFAKLFRRGGEFGGGGATGAFQTQEDRNVAAFLEMLWACEGTGYPEGWGALFGWRPGRTDRLFVPGDDHPRIAFHLDGRPLAPGEPRVAWQYTTAAGKPQLTESTYDRLCRVYGHRDMRPAGQMRSAMDLIGEQGVLPAVRRGDVVTAVNGLGRIWASLPSSKVPQPHRDWDFVRRAFTAHGGVLA